MSPTPPAARLRWPAPALLAWLAAAALHAGLHQAGLPAPLAWALAAALPLAAWPFAPGVLRRAVLLAGFPLATGLLGSTALPAWAWLLPLAALLGLYPLRAWRDAPFFPTPAAALDGLAATLPLPAGARVLDAGCGAGHGLRALRRAYPQARLEGVEWSRPLAAWARAWRRDATVRRGDLWADAWGGFDLVYCFQRPETMARVQAKAAAELRPGAWLISLEFPLPDRRPEARLEAGGRPLWLYRQPGGPGGRRR